MDSQNKRGIVRVEAKHGAFLAFENDLITNQLTEFGAHTRNELAMLLDQIDEDDTVIDLGAHIGTYAIPIAQKLGEGGRLLAVEGNPATFDLLKRNIALNALERRISAVCAVVGSASAQRLDRVEAPGNTGAGYYIRNSEAPIEAVDALKIIRDLGFGRPNFIKIDVEGMEPIVLRSLSEILNEHCPKLYVEVVKQQIARFDGTVQDIDSFLRSFGYRFFRNIGERNSQNDRYEQIELASLEEGGDFFDVLALPG
jgi:FkbM family methyltransferase